MGAPNAPPVEQISDLEAENAELRAELDRLRSQYELLRLSEKMYRFSAEAGRRLVWSTDPEGKVIAISRIFKSVAGVDHGDDLTEGWLKAVHPYDRARVLEQWKQCLQTGDPYSIQFRGILPDGSERMVLSKAMAARDSEGRILRWYGSTDDVHEEYETERARREAEARLRESEELHRFTVELTQQIVWSLEADGTGLTMSPRYYQLTGMGPSDDPILSIHPDDRERIVSASAAAMEAGIPNGAECRLRMKDGRYRSFRVRASPLRDPDGRIVRWYGLTEDIHEERLAEQTRREVEERYRLAVQATNDAVWDYDVANDTIEWSDNSADIFGSGGAPIGRTSLDWWRDRLHREDKERVIRSFDGAIMGGESHWLETYRFRRGDGSYADMLDRGFIIRDAAGKAIRAVGAMADVTERNRAEAEIRGMQTELIHVSRLSAMGAMASTLAHELNQPLAAISNFINGARRLAASVPEVQADLLVALEAASSGAQRAGEIVRRLRELVSRGTVSVLVEHLPRLIEEANVLAFVDEGVLGVQHRLELDPDAQWVRVDRIQIQQVLINLIRNAVDAMEHCQKREIVISTHSLGEMVEVRVADTGAGIAPEHFDSLFSRFMTTKSGGMGIGLPISRTIIELHGGKIWAGNRPEGGAVFCFTLPSTRPAKQNPPESV